MNLNTKKLFHDAEAGGYAIGQFNASTADQIKGIIGTAARMRAPVIVATSEGECAFIGARQVVKLCEAYEEEAGIPIILNADHTYKDAEKIENLDKIKALLTAGYNSIHFDGSVLSFEDNVRWTKQVGELCKEKDPGISVEGELGTVSGVEDQIKVAEDEAALCSPVQAIEFIEKTGVDLFAPAIGTAHGVYSRF